MALRRCTLCKGRKRVYRIGNNSWSVSDMGGTVETCPECRGAGFIDVPIVDELPIKPVLVKKSSKANQQQDVANG